MATAAITQTERKPVPRVNEVSLEQPWEWISRGWSDLKRAPRFSLTYGAFFALVSVLMTLGLFSEGLFFIVHDATGELVATAGANHSPSPLHPFAGQLGWVAVSPGHRGKRLGCCVCAAAVKRYLDAGYTDIYLQTDDWRLPAITTYLKLGFVPLLFAPDMEERWQDICSKLNVDFNKIRCLTPH